MANQKLREFMEKPWVKKVMRFLKEVWYILKVTAEWCYQLRSLLLSIPVLTLATAFAIRNARLLPAEVGIGLKDNGAYMMLLSRSAAVLLPLVITCLCVVFIFCSKKVVHPWLVSLLSLVLPLAIWFSTTFPA